MPWRRQWHPTPGLLPGESHGQRSLAGCRPGVAQSRRDWGLRLSPSPPPYCPLARVLCCQGCTGLHVYNVLSHTGCRGRWEGRVQPPSHLLVSTAPSWVNPEPSRLGAGCDQESSPFTRSTTSQPQTVQQRSPLLRNEAGHQGFYYENSYVWDWFDYFSNTTGAKQNMSVEFGQGATDPQPCFPAFCAAKPLLGFSKLPIWIHKFVTNLEKAFLLHVTLPSLTYTSEVIFL